MNKLLFTAFAVVVGFYAPGSTAEPSAKVIDNSVKIPIAKVNGVTVFDETEKTERINRLQATGTTTVTIEDIVTPGHEVKIATNAVNWRSLGDFKGSLHKDGLIFKILVIKQLLDLYTDLGDTSKIQEYKARYNALKSAYGDVGQP